MTNASQPTSTNDVQDQTDEDKKKSRGKKFLSNAFNFVAGFAVAATVKTAVTAAVTWACAPVASGLVLSAVALGLSAVAVGGAMGTFAWAKERHQAKAAGLDTPKFWSDENKARMKSSTIWALLGGAAFFGIDAAFFGDDNCVVPAATTTSTVVVDNVVAPAVIVPEVTPAPVVIPEVTEPVFENPLLDEVVCTTPMDFVAEMIETQSETVSQDVLDAFERAQSTNEAVAMQGTKDLAYALFNGDGIEKDASTALQMFCDAASNGNIQAQVDTLYIQFHGLHGVTADPQSAFEAMKSIGDDRAEWFVSEWAKSGMVEASSAATPVSDALAQLKTSTGCGLS